MPKLKRHSGKPHTPDIGFFSANLAAMFPILIIFYASLVLPFLPDDGKGRPENMIFWPVAASLTLVLVIQNRARIDWRFFRTLPIVSLIAYLVFAAASITWAYSPDYAFSRLVVHILAFLIVVLPFALPISTKLAIPGAHLCTAVALMVSAVYVLTTPP